MQTAKHGSNGNGRTKLVEATDLEIARSIRLMPGRVMVEKPEVAEETKAHKLPGSTLWVPDKTKDRFHEGGFITRVVSVGPDTPPEIYPGALVIIPYHAGQPIFLGRDVPYWIIGWGDCMAVVEMQDEPDPAQLTLPFGFSVGNATQDYR